MSEQAGGTARTIRIDTLRDVLSEVMKVPLWWVALLGIVAFLSTIEFTMGPSPSLTFHITAITVVAVAVIWLPPLVKVIALNGGGVKTPAGEATATGLGDILEKLEPTQQMQALTGVIAAIPDAGPGVDPRVASVRRQLEQKTAEIPVDPGSAGQRLAALARRYDLMREALPSGNERTYQMNQLVAEAAGLGRASGITWDTIPEIADRKEGGARVVALALVQARPRPSDLTVVVDSIQHALTPFEQYQALKAADSLLIQMADPDRKRLGEAIRERMNAQEGVVIDNRDVSRLMKAKAILERL